MQKFLRGKNLKKYGNIDELEEAIRKQYFKDVRKFYQDYIQERVLKKNGNIEFSKKGIQEQLRWNPQQGKNYPELIQDIKNAKRLPDEPNLKPEQKPKVSHYEVYEGKSGKHYIEVLKDGQKRYYITINKPIQKAGTSKDTIRATSTGVLAEPNNIINDVNEKINPKNGILKGRVEMTAESEPRSFSDMIRETARSKNKHIEEDIFERHLRLKNQSASEKYRGYKNPVTGEDKIYTREDINHMSEAEYHRHKKAITAQKLRIGIPTNTEMEKAGAHGGVVHVNAYTRGDGTHVRSYWRSAPN